MRINFELIRDLLLIIENESTTIHGVLFVDSSEMANAVREALGDTIHRDLPAYQKDLESKFTLDEIKYHLNYCIKAELIYDKDKNFSPDIYIPDLTVKGHEYINLIREKSHWEKLKEFLNKAKEPLTIEAITLAGERLLNSALGS
ncbi:DUF2513 domain-containing protein [uncultured Veillonella sp.]|uniref:DUF2513 domain-containing protein n=1 Tax=uncultured Veillonella sp. TaxID=159268 RepID=UPI0026082467|nr:DUF2513 domain-containing protein [uncultured Veillonella sp.]